MKMPREKVNRFMVMVGTNLPLALLTLFLIPLRGSDKPADSGQKTYAAKCSICHAADGSGNTAMGKKLKLKDLRSPEVQKQSEAKLAEIIAKGKSPMPAYGKQLDKKKIDEVVAYLRELAKKR